MDRWHGYWRVSASFAAVVASAALIVGTSAPAFAGEGGTDTATASQGQMQSVPTDQTAADRTLTADQTVDQTAGSESDGEAADPQPSPTTSTPAASSSSAPSPKTDATAPAQSAQPAQEPQNDQEPQNAESPAVSDLAASDAPAPASEAPAPAAGTATQSSEPASAAEPAQPRTLDELAAANRDVIAEGTYTILSAVGNGMALDVASGSTDPGANVQIWSDNGSGAQQWTVTKDAKGYLTITNVRSGKALDVLYGLAQPDTNVQQYTPNGMPAQKWIAIPDGDGVVLRSAVSGDTAFALDVLYGRPEAGTNVQIYLANGLPAQRWIFSKLPDMPAAIHDYWAVNQWLGRPLAAAETASDGSVTQTFVGGTVIVDAKRHTPASIWTRWTREGGAKGYLGDVTDNIVVRRPDGSYEKRFAHGFIRATNADDPNATIALGGSIYDYWNAHQDIGQPTGNRGETVGLGHWQQFERGSVYTSPTAGTHFVTGGILNEYIAQGAERGILGFPLTDESPISGGASQVFEHGQIHWSAAAGAHFTRGGIQEYWAANGWQDGWLGYPVAGEVYNLRDGGASQAFEHGHVFWSPSTGAHGVAGGIRDQYAALAWENSSYGYPTSEEYDWGQGHAQNFQGGVLVWNGCGKKGWQNPGQYFQVSSCNVSVPANGMFGYASPTRIGMSATREQAIEAMISRAYDYMGTRYVWDYALQPGVGVDCAGLVMQSLYAAGLNISGDYNPSNHWYDPWHSHDANNMAADGRFMHVSLNDRQRGDLITWPGHIAIYLGGDQIIEANVPAVRVNSLWAYGTPSGVLRPFV